MARFAAVFLAWHASAWSTPGHERINRVAENLLVGSQRDRIRHMMHSDPVDMSNWEKVTTVQNPDSVVLHWHHQDPEWTCAKQLGDHGHIKCNDHSAEQGSLFCGLAYFFQEFSSKALLEQYPDLEEPVNAPHNLAVLQGKELSDSEDLRWLVTLIGDLHQPLHWLHEREYGQGVNVSYRGEIMTLLEMWESYIPLRLPPPPPADVVRRDYDKHSAVWEHRVPTDLFRDWAKDMAAIVCGEIYPAIEVNHADGSRKIPNPFVIDEALFHNWLNLANTVIELGGQRVAFVLQDILRHKKHKILHTEGRGLLHSRWVSGLLTNVVLALFLVPTLLAVFTLHLRTGAPSLFKWRRAKV